MNKPTRSYVIQDLDLDNDVVLIVTAVSEAEAVERFVQWYKEEEIPGYEDVTVENFYETYSTNLVQSI